jgi:hypothetical protein
MVRLSGLLDRRRKRYVPNFCAENFMAAVYLNIYFVDLYYVKLAKDRVLGNAFLVLFSSLILLPQIQIII